MYSWDDNTQAANEVKMLRAAAKDAVKVLGSYILIRRRYTAADYAAGNVQHCSTCWNEVTHMSNDSRCPECFGTGYTGGGYHPVETVRAIVNKAGREDYKLDKNGERMQYDARVTLPPDEHYLDGDVFATVLSYTTVNDVITVTSLGEYFEIDGALALHTLQGQMVDAMKSGTWSIDDILVNQTADAKKMVPTDPRIAASFWGL